LIDGAIQDNGEAILDWLVREADGEPPQPAAGHPNLAGLIDNARRLGYGLTLDADRTAYTLKQGGRPYPKIEQALNAHRSEVLAFLVREAGRNGRTAPAPIVGETASTRTPRR
jgi:hypothetical protein